jgi:hypothetical protein
MRILKPALTGLAIALAGLTFSMTDAAVAKTKKSDAAATAQKNPDETQRPSDLGGSDRQLQGRFYKKSHKKAKSSS